MLLLLKYISILLILTNYAKKNVCSKFLVLYGN